MDGGAAGFFVYEYNDQVISERFLSFTKIFISYKYDLFQESGWLRSWIWFFIQNYELFEGGDPPSHRKPVGGGSPS